MSCSCFGSPKRREAVVNDRNLPVQNRASEQNASALHSTVMACDDINRSIQVPIEFTQVPIEFIVAGSTEGGRLSPSATMPAPSTNQSKSEKPKGLFNGFFDRRSASDAAVIARRKNILKLENRRHSVTTAHRQKSSASPFSVLSRRKSMTNQSGDIIDTTAAFYRNHFAQRQREACFDVDYNDIFQSMPLNQALASNTFVGQSQPLPSIQATPKNSTDRVDDGVCFSTAGLPSPGGDSEMACNTMSEIDETAPAALPQYRRRSGVGMTRDGDINVLGIPIERLKHLRGSVSAPIPLVLDDAQVSATSPLPRVCEGPGERRVRRRSGVFQSVAEQGSSGGGGSADLLAHLPRYSVRRSSVLTNSTNMSCSFSRLQNNEEFVSDDEEVWDEEVNELADLEPAYRYEGFGILGDDDAAPSIRPRPKRPPEVRPQSSEPAPHASSRKNSKEGLPILAAVEVRSVKEARALEALARASVGSTGGAVYPSRDASDALDQHLLIG